VRHLSKLEMSPKPKWYSADTFDEPPYMLSGAFEERNYHMGMHMHDFYEICLVLDGFTVHHTENGTADADAGMIFIIPPGILHGFEKCAENNAHVVNLFFHRSFFLRYSTDLTAMASYPALFTSNCTVELRASGDSLAKLSTAALELAKRNVARDVNATYLNSLGLSFMALLCHLHQLEKMDKGQAKNPAVMECIDYMRKNISENISAEQLNRIAFCSGSTLRRSFESIVGISPMQYLGQLRIQKAIELLQSTAIPLCDVAQQCGYYDSAHFCKKFRASMGISPKDYRKKYGITQ